MVDLHGGPARLLSKLQELFQTSGNFKVGSYGQQVLLPAPLDECE